MFDEPLREIKDSEMKQWNPLQQGVAVKIIESFLSFQI